MNESRLISSLKLFYNPLKGTFEINVRDHMSDIREYVEYKFDSINVDYLDNVAEFLYKKGIDILIEKKKEKRIDQA